MASSDGVDVSDLGEWIHLKRGVVLQRTWPNRSTWTPQHALRWDDRLVGPRADLVGAPRIYSLFLPVIWEERCPTMALHVSLNLGVEAALMCLGSLGLSSCARNPHVVPRDTQIPTQPQFT
ncbi:hypothetical protein M9H77_21076 [Catharanthus roseus]|uniref:Uncharacterized protein n=1 Tax=Catharanthus roseus TaxID=4058 RepID=A0ACC0ALC1_CATRO|nr:hypothetical protein M9H77_21076 [Catharanthus roseus]